jgi:hypothetical protein
VHQEDPQPVPGRRIRNPGLGEELEDPVAEAPRIGAARALPGQRERDEIGMPHQRVVAVAHDGGDAFPRREGRAGQRDLADQVVEHGIHQGGLAVDVAVQGIRRDAQPAGDRTHREPARALVREGFASGGDDPGEREACAFAGGSPRCHRSTVQCPI